MPPPDNAQDREAPPRRETPANVSRPSTISKYAARSVVLVNYESKNAAVWLAASKS